MDVWSCARQARLFLCVIFFISFVLRLVLFFGYMQHDKHYLLDFDSDQYRQIAQSLVDGKGFADKDGKPTAYRLPGYPLYLAGCNTMTNFLCGEHLVFAHPECRPHPSIHFASQNTQDERSVYRRVKRMDVNGDFVAMILQIMFASFIPVLMFLFASFLFPEQILVAQIATIAAVVHPGFVMYAGILSTEVPFMFFFLMFLILFFFLLGSGGNERKKWWLWLACGGVLGMASLFRANGPYLFLFVLGVIVLHFGWRLKESCFAGAWISVGWLTPLLWWMIRNCIVFGSLFLHTLPGLHFLQYSATYVVMDQKKCDYFKARDHLFAIWHTNVATQEKKMGKKLNEYEYYKEAEKVAFDCLLSSPLFACKHACVQIARTCGTLYSTLFLYVIPGTDYGDASLWFKIKLYLFPRVQKPWLAILVYHELLFSLFLLIGLLLSLFVFGMCPPVRWRFFLLYLFAAFLIFITLAYGCARLRMPAEPFFIVLAAQGWASLAKKKWLK